MLEIIFFKSKKLKHDFQNLKKNSQLEMINNTLLRFCTDPAAYQIKKLKPSGEIATYRLRKGNIRILFDIDYENKMVIVYRIKQRKEGYE